MLALVNDEDLIDVSESNWYKKMSSTVKPGDSLRSLRTMRKMKQTELAKKIGVEPRQISDIENGRAPIGKKMAMKLSKVLDMDYRLFL